MLSKFFLALILFITSITYSANAESVDSLLMLVDTTRLSKDQVRLKLLIVDELKDSDIKQAILFAKDAFKDAQAIKDKNLIAQSQLAIGKCYNYLGANSEALNNVSKALTMFDDIGDKSNKAQTLLEIGNIYYFSWRFDLGLKYYEEAFDCGKALNDKHIILKATLGKGSIYGNTNRLDSALIIFNETFQLAKEIDDKQNEIHSLYNIGDVYRFTNRSEKALGIFKLIEQSYDDIEINSRLLTNLYLSFTDTYIQLSDIKNAQRYNHKTKEVLQRYPNNNRKLRYYFHSFQIDTMLGNPNLAIKKHIRFKELSDSISSDKFNESLANFQILYGLNAKEEEIERLRLDNELKDLSLKQRKIVIYGSVISVFLLLLVVFQTFRSIKRSKEKNRILQTQREELAAANEELTVINDELHTQREELQSTLTVLKDTQNKLISSEKMASLGILAAGVAHEINNPLNFIKGGALAIENYVKGNLEGHSSEVFPLLEIINVGVERAAGIVKSLNQYSKKDDIKTNRVIINTVIDSCLIMLGNELGGRVSVRKDFANEPLLLECKEGKIQQAFLNILTNAVQSIEGKGTIAITTSQKGKFIVVIITDSGCGISLEDLNRVTDPFFTTKDPGKGTGLGLSITQSIIEEHNGSISFSSTVGVGTTVTVQLPLKG